MRCYCCNELATKYSKSRDYCLECYLAIVEVIVDDLEVDYFVKGYSKHTDQIEYPMSVTYAHRTSTKRVSLALPMGEEYGTKES